MNQILSQVRRIWSDHGRGDKDFSEDEARLREAQSNLLKSANLLKRTSEILSGLIESRGLEH